MDSYESRFQAIHFHIFWTRSAIELLFDDIEQRIRRFWNCFIGKYIRNSMERLVEAFVEFRNWKIKSKGNENNGENRRKISINIDNLS